jgi:subtilisin family serine protease
LPKYPHHPAFRAVTAALGTAILASALVLPAYASPTTSSHGPGSQSRETADISPQLRSVTSKKNGASSKKAWVDQEGDTVEAIVYFKDAGVQALAQGDPEAAAHSLQQTAQSHWAKVDTALGEIPGVTVLNRFWITSSILVRAKNDVKTLEQLAALPGATDVLPNAEIKGLDEGEGKPEPVNKPTVVSASNDQVTYGLSTIGADESWQDYGVKGEGVRVAVLDTGVDATHPDIANKLVGHNSGDPTFPGGWMNFDRFGKPVSSKPTDPGSHGTHVSGTVVGGNASGTKIGVAPNAELMAANVLSGGGSTAKIQAALQWVMAPTDANGKPAGRAADVINMSLGSDGYDPTLIQAIRNIRDAGIFPAVAIGNAPCGPTGASSPGDIYESFGVGMTDDKNVVNRGSCGTTATWPADIVKQYNWPKSFVKPNASAPGVKVFSAMPGGRWGESSGTSMASPHVAGAVALLRSVQAGLSVDEIQQALESTAYHPNPAAAPDTRYGAGVINVHRAIAKVLKQAGVKGTVTDATTGKPVSGVTVSYVRCNSGSCDEPGHGETWNTTQEGKFTARIVPGDYEFSFSQFGYEPSQPVKVTVNQTGFVDLNTKLTAVTTGTVTGTVTNAATGEPVKGTTVTVMRQGLTTTTDASGTFTFANLPIGSYEFKAEADGMRAMVSDVAEVKPAQTTRVNFKLDALKRVIVLGGPDAQTATLLAENDFVADFSPTVPDNLDAYDAVVWDAPDGVDEATLKRAIAQTDKSKTGIVWLDLGVDNNSGIAALNSLLKNPAVRTGVVDEKVTATAYRVLKARSRDFCTGHDLT